MCPLQEVAVKKFLVQDLTGDVLVQFKCEVSIDLLSFLLLFVLFTILAFS